MPDSLGRFAWVDEAQAIMDKVASCPAGRCFWFKPPGQLVPVFCPCPDHAE